MEELFRNKIQKVYKQLGDVVSKEIFRNRLLYSLVGDESCIHEVIKTIPEGAEFISEIEQLVEEGREVCIFGAGIWAEDIVNAYPNMKIKCFIDNNLKKSGSLYMGVPVIHFDEWKKNDKQNSVIIISTRLYYREIYEQLIQNDIQESRIMNVGKLLDELSERQYFDLPELDEARLPEETLVDAGAFDGKTSMFFVQWAKNSNNRIFAFEPEECNREKCKKNLDSIHADYKIVPVGLWDEEDTLKFASGASGASHVVDDAQEAYTTIRVNALDAVINEPVSFIKMDIEGSERRALIGAKETIKKYRPKLAISIYHKPEDIWELPSLLLEYVPDYTFYLRHYSVCNSETVLYCI